MSRRITPGTSVDNLKREAKRWLQALRAGEPVARGRFARALEAPPADPGLREVQHALARRAAACEDRHRSVVPSTHRCPVA